MRPPSPAPSLSASPSGAGAQVVFSLLRLFWRWGEVFETQLIYATTGGGRAALIPVLPWATAVLPLLAKVTAVVGATPSQQT